MANFPFKDATFTSHIGFEYPELDYGRVYYTKINGVITAIKPIAIGIYNSTTEKDRSWKVLKAMAADGNTYNLNLCGRYIFLTSRDAVEHEKKAATSLYGTIGVKDTRKVVESNGARHVHNTIQMYYWGSDGQAWECDGGYIFWVDKDGEHIEFKTTDKDGRKLYLNKASCVNENVKVLDFTDDIPIPDGEYTVKREFTVKAHSQEEAERIISDRVMKSYNEHNKVHQ